MNHCIHVLYLVRILLEANREINTGKCDIYLYCPLWLLEDREKTHVS